MPVCVVVSEILHSIGLSRKINNKSIQSGQIFAKAAHCPHIAQIPDLESEHDHSLYLQNHHPRWHSGNNQSVGASVSVVSMWL